MYPLIVLLLLVCILPLWAQPLDRATLVENFKQWDLMVKEGKGLSESADSGTLGWGEAPYLRAYANLWLVTNDPYWLGKIEDHFARIMASAGDPDGDGFLGWQTATYSGAVSWAQPLNNMGTATMEPPFGRQTSEKLIKEATGHVYVINFLDPASFTIQDQTTRQVLVDKQAYKDGEVITAIPGSRVTIKGAPRAGDRFMVRTLQPEPTEFSVHEGMIAHPVAIFIEAVSKDEKLKERFGASAEKFLTFINRNMVQKHEKDWVEFDWPMGEGQPPVHVGAYRFADLITDRFPNRVMPHNQYLALARVYLILQNVPGADPLMKPRAELMARFFRACLQPRDNAWVWNYWDWIEAGEVGHSGFEDTGHGHIDVGFAVEAGQRGVVFTDDDLKRMSRTLLDVMWNQDENAPKVGPRVDTRGDQTAFILADYLDLCQWEPKIYELATKVFEPKTMMAVPTMLRAEQLCGKQ